MYSQVVTKSMVVAVFGVANPNLVGNFPTDPLAFAILGSEYQVKYYNSSVPGLLFTKAADIIDVVALNSSKSTVRQNVDLQFSINSRVALRDAAKGGLLMASFPDDFITDVFLSKCSAQAAFSLYSYCYMSNNMLYVKSTNAASDTSSKGSLNLAVTNIRSEEIAGPTATSSSNYDSTLGVVLSRSFPNLSNSFLKYSSDGLEIIINENQPIILQVGAFSDPIPIRASEKMKQSISIIPLYFDSAFLFNKNPINLDKDSMGDTFRIAAPQTMLRRRFYLTFTKTGDIQPTYYASVPKVPVDVVSVSTLKNIVAEASLYANLDGMSIPMMVYTDNAPYKEVIISITIANDLLGHVTLSTSQVTLSKNSNKDYFYVSQIDPSYPNSDLTFQFSLSGVDQPSFQLANVNTVVPVNPTDATNPELLDMSIVNITRSSMSFNVVCDRLCYIHCITTYQAS